MSQKIQFRRGTDAARQTVVFDLGEPVFTTDTNKFYIGNGATTGGLSVGGIFSNGENYEIVETTDNAVTNAINLLTAFNNASAKTPYGLPLSSTNRYSIFLPPGVYDLTSTGIYATFKQYISIIGLSNNAQDIVLKTTDGIASSNPAPIFMLAYACTGLAFKNLSLYSYNTGVTSSTTPIYIAPITPYNGIVDITLDNLYLYQSGTNPYSDSAIFYGAASDQLVSGIRINNISTKGSVFTSPSQQAKIYDMTISNSTIYGEFLGHCHNYNTTRTSTIKNIISNCSVIKESGTLFAGTNSKAFSGYLFKDCYFKASGMFYEFGTLSALRLVNSEFENCYFDGYINSFNGKMRNCTIKSNTPNKAAVEFQITQGSVGNYLPQFTDCTFISMESYPSVTGLTNGTVSGLFINCSFNNPIYTGMTGQFSSDINNTNIISPYIS